MTVLIQGPRSVCVSSVYVLLHMYCMRCVLQKGGKTLKLTKKINNTQILKSKKLKTKKKIKQNSLCSLLPFVSVPSPDKGVVSDSKGPTLSYCFVFPSMFAY